MAKQLNDFITQNGISTVNQSVYKGFHSTKTTLLEIKNNLSIFVDSGKAVVLTFWITLQLLILLITPLKNCLKLWFGGDGTAMMSINFYFYNHKQNVSRQILITLCHNS